jgi:predicted thioesterase
VTFRAKVTRLEGKEAAVSIGAYVDEKQCAQANTQLVRVSAEEFPL